MKKFTKMISLALAIITILSCLCFTPAFAATTSLSGAGTEASPFLIKTADDLAFFRSKVNSAKGDKNHYRLEADIDLNGITITTPIGISSNHFKGTFDGNGHKIYNFNLDDATHDKNFGFFGIVNGATIKNLTLSDFTAKLSKTQGAAFAARVNGNPCTFTNCHVINGSIVASANAIGAFVGFNEAGSTLTDCTTDVDITVVDEHSGIAQFLGYNKASATFTNCVANGTLTGKSLFSSAGFVGVSVAGKVYNYSFSSCANLTGIFGTKNLAGFIGQLGDSTASFNNCYNAGDITATLNQTHSVYVAHFVAIATDNAFKNCSFTKCYVLTDVSLTGGKSFSNVSGSTVFNPNKTLTNYCIIGFGGSNAQFELEVDRLGLNCPEYDAMTKAEFLLKAGKDSTIAFHGLGDTVVIGHQELKGRADNAAKYDARLIAAVNSLDYPAGFEVKSGSETVKHGVKKAYTSILANNVTITAPKGYYFITLVITDLNENQHSLDFSAYIDKNDTTVKDDVLKSLGAHRVGTYDVGDGNSMALYRGVSKQYFNLLCEDLAKKYTLIQSNDSNGNLSRTFFSDTTMNHVYWNPSSGEMRLITDKNFTQNKLPVDESHTDGSYPVKLHQLQAYTGTGDGGLGFVIRLSDGRFIVVDGGHNTDTEVKEIYDFMVANQVTDTITIAAWVITHEHGDHVAAFQGFAATYSDKVTLEHVLINSCDTTEQTKYASVSSTAVNSALLKFPGAVKHKTFTGQKYKFASTTIEILYSMPDFFPRIITNEADATSSDKRRGNGNIQSMILMMDLDSQPGGQDNLLVLGDSTSAGLNIVASRYGSYIEAKYVQVSHHGHVIKFDDFTDPGKAKYCRRDNCVQEVYELTKCSVAFWPTSESWFTERRSLHGPNKWLIENCETHIKAFNSYDTRTIVIG